MSLINCTLLIRRCCHFKFKASNLAKQATILKRFNDDIEATMEKIKRNRKVKVSRGRAAIAQTTSVLLKQGEMAPVGTRDEFDSGAGISEGSPEQLAIRREGMSRTFLTTRMKVLNTNFSRVVAEIFVADEEMAKLVEDFSIRITQVNC